MTRPAFVDRSPKAGKAQRGKTPASATPVNVRTNPRTPVADALRDQVRIRLGRQLGRFAERIERASVRFEDVNGPRRGVDTLCRIKIVLSGLPSLVKEQRAASPREAFDLCADGPLRPWVPTAIRSTRRFASLKIAARGSPRTNEVRHRTPIGEGVPEDR